MTRLNHSFVLVFVLAAAIASQMPAKAAPPPLQPRRRRRQSDRPATGGRSQISPSVASHGRFATIASTEPALKIAMVAQDLQDASKRIGSIAAFHGTVTNVYSPHGNGIIILDFDPNYRNALVAIVKPDSYAKFPPIRSLTGKQLLISGKFIDYEGRAEVQLTSPTQIKIIH